MNTPSTLTLQLTPAPKKSTAHKMAAKSAGQRAKDSEFLRSKLFPQSPAGIQEFVPGSNDDILHAVALPGKGVVATVFQKEFGLRVFAADIGMGALNTCESVFGEHSRGLVYLDDDLIATGVMERVSTWRKSTGEHLESVQVASNQDYITAMAAIGKRNFVAGTSNGALLFFSHLNGRNLQEIADGNSPHSDWITSIAVRGDVLVTASGDKSAAVWSTSTYEKIASLDEHNGIVSCVTISDHYIVTGSADSTIRVYENDGPYPLVRALKGLHSSWVWKVAFASEELLMSVSTDGIVMLTSLSDGRSLVRVDVGVKGFSAIMSAENGLARVGMNSEAKMIDASKLTFGNAGSTEVLFGGPSAHPLCKEQRVEFGSGESAFDYEELKKSSLDVEAIQTMKRDALSKVVAAVMVNFEDECHPRLPLLAGCLNAVFGKKCIAGDLFVGLPEGKLFTMVVEELRLDSVYRAMGDDTTVGFEWRLQRFLQRVRV